MAAAMESNLVFRPMEQNDIDDVVNLEVQSFATPWSRQSFEEELENPRARYLIAVLDGEAAGYAGAWLILDEAHVTNVAVASRHRRRGVGEALMRALIALAKEDGAGSMTLEVRPSNGAARAMYAKLGFKAAGVRKNYYEDTREDALIMWLDDLQKK